jgi:hypothetical protein
MPRPLRILLLLLVLALVAGTHFYQRYTLSQWRTPVRVDIYPINADGASETAAYIQSLSADEFDAIPAFFAREGGRYGHTRTSLVSPRLRPELHAKPPPPPANPSPWRVMAWSLGLRGWVFRHIPSYGLATTSVRLFVLYHQPQPGLVLPHSLGLRQGLIGVVHAFAAPTQAAQNNIVLAHELLHTLGASDKYDPHGQPLFPHGLADPGQDPLYPQVRAEIMGGRLALAPGEAAMPLNLDACVVGPATALEINWTSHLSTHLPVP